MREKPGVLVTFECWSNSVLQSSPRVEGKAIRKNVITHDYVSRVSRIRFLRSVVISGGPCAEHCRQWSVRRSCNFEEFSQSRSITALLFPPYRKACFRHAVSGDEGQDSVTCGFLVEAGNGDAECWPYIRVAPRNLVMQQQCLLAILSLPLLCSLAGLPLVQSSSHASCILAHHCLAQNMIPWILPMSRPIISAVPGVIFHLEGGYQYDSVRIVECWKYPESSISRLGAKTRGPAR
jgi:hypothetical protein